MKFSYRKVVAPSCPHNNSLNDISFEAEAEQQESRLKKAVEGDIVHVTGIINHVTTQKPGPKMLNYQAKERKDENALEESKS